MNFLSPYHHCWLCSWDLLYWRSGSGPWSCLLFGGPDMTIIAKPWIVPYVIPELSVSSFYLYWQRLSIANNSDPRNLSTLWLLLIHFSYIFINTGLCLRKFWRCCTCIRSYLCKVYLWHPLPLVIWRGRWFGYLCTVAPEVFGHRVSRTRSYHEYWLSGMLCMVMEFGIFWYLLRYSLTRINCFIGGSILLPNILFLI